MDRVYGYLYYLDIKSRGVMKALKHVVHLTVLLAVCMLMVACPEPDTDPSGLDNEFEVNLGFPGGMGATSRSTINDDEDVDKVYVKVFNSSGEHLPSIDSDGITVLDRISERYPWSATVRLAKPASGTIGFEVWAVNDSAALVYAGWATLVVGQNYNKITVPTQAVRGLRTTGPAGGLIFYDKGSYSGGWRFLEAAPSDIESDIVFGKSHYAHISGYYRPTEYQASTLVGTSTAIGTGKTNTEALVSKMGKTAYTTVDFYNKTITEYYAARLCDIHEAGGDSDWFLPSKDELDQMFQNLRAHGMGGFPVDNYYLSSSESSNEYMWTQYFYNRTQLAVPRSYDLRVRPVRAF